MCELHFYRCKCGHRWVAHKKLASCESDEADVRCPESLCMYVGNAKRPQRMECAACAQMREIWEALEDEAADCGGGIGVGAEGVPGGLPAGVPMSVPMSVPINLGESMGAEGRMEASAWQFGPALGGPDGCPVFSQTGTGARL